MCFNIHVYMSYICIFFLILIFFIGLDIISQITKYTLLLVDDALTSLDGIDFVNKIRGSILKIGSRNGNNYHRKHLLKSLNTFINCFELNILLIKWIGKI